MKNYIIIIFIYFTISTITQVFVLSDNIYIQNFQDTLNNEQINNLIQQGKKWKFIGLIISPILILIKCSLAALCLSIGIFIFNDRFEFEKMFEISIKAEFIFIIPAFIKILWFLFIQTSYTLQDLQYFSPLSALSIFDPETLENWQIYPLQLLNLFEVMYWFVLAHLILKQLPELNINQSMAIVMASYGTGLVIWVALIMFLTLTYA